MTPPELFHGTSTLTSSAIGGTLIALSTRERQHHFSSTSHVCFPSMDVQPSQFDHSAEPPSKYSRPPTAPSVGVELDVGRKVAVHELLNLLR